MIHSSWEDEMVSETIIKDRTVGEATNAGDASPITSTFKLRAQLLDQGRTDKTVAKTGNMVARLKVYASGGENALHTHPNEDHMFVVMQGSARFYDKDGGSQELQRHEGIMIPAGAYYWFEATSAEPLVLMRVGSRIGPQSTAGRINIRGEDMAGNSEENKTVPVIYREGAYFE
jgi:mannose-6-phosphate isomerase-like protein (cupin superfamily)